jgi:membrane fusion protein (multidrug efflux system)
MKFSFWLAWILIVCNTAIFAEEQAVVTEVAVETGKIIKTTLYRYVMAYGMVEPVPAMFGKPAASSKVSAPVMGILDQVHCEEGQQVKKGAVLFELDSRNSDALLAKAEIALNFARKNFARKQQLNATENISRKLYDEAEQQLEIAQKDLLNARVQRELLQIKAPISGTVTTVHYKIGEVVSLNTIMAEVLDLERLDIAIHIPSPEATELKLGQKVLISTESKFSATGITSQGNVTYIGSQIDPLTDTLLVRISLNSNFGLRPGQFIHAHIQVEERAKRLAVPIESVITTEESNIIAVVEGDSAKLKTIKIGLRDGNLVEIEGENLRESMTIVTQGAYGLMHDTRIRVLNK